MSNLINTNTPLKPFKFWCQTVMPLVFDDSLSYYELLCKVVKQLNDTIEAVNNDQLAITELQELFIELKNYVDNYFTSSDFTKLVNDRLDEMATDGTLKNLLQEIIDDTYIFTFKNYADMINFNLNVGNIAKTLGRETPGDGGHATYQITENTADNLYNTTLTNGKTATKLIEKETNVLAFGIKPLDNISSSINLILEKEHTVYFNSGTYLINFDFRILPQSNQKIIGNNTTIKIEGSYSTNFYAMVQLIDVENVTIENLIIDGSKANSVLEEGNGGQCLVVGNKTRNILIKNCTFKNSWYDGISIDNDDDNKNNHVDIANCIFINNGRNGISVLSFLSVDITKCTFTDIHDKSPGCAIDVEPYSPTTSKVGNISISDIWILNCQIGLANYLEGSTTDIDSFNINVSNINIDNKDITGTHTVGVQLGYLSKTKLYGTQLYSNVSIKNTDIGVRIRDYNKNAPVMFNNLLLDTITELPILFTNMYTWSSNQGAFELNNVKIINSDTLSTHLKFETQTTNYVTYSNIRINNINTYKISGWNLLSNSVIHNNLTKTILAPETIKFTEYYDLYSMNYASPDITFPTLSDNLITYGLPINILANFGFGSLTGTFFPTSLSGAKGIRTEQLQSFTIRQVSTRWVITNVVGNTTKID